MRRLLFAVAVCTGVLGTAGPSVLASGSSYTIKNLGTISGIVPHITDLNASGSASGWYHSAAGDRAVRYTDAAGWVVIPGLESLTSYANGINDHDDVVGEVTLANGNIRAFRYTDAGGLELVEPLAGGSFSSGNGINNNGEITGYSNSSAGFAAFRQSPQLLAQRIDTLGGMFSGGCGINESGQVAGIALTSTMVQHGFRANVDGSVAEITPIAGASATSWACAIDDDGTVTGQGEIGNGVQHAFIFNGTNLTDIDAFGSPWSDGLGISRGVTVGYYTLQDNVTTHAFMHSTATGIVDLNNLLPAGSGWVLTSATAVNSKGAIAGDGTFNGQKAVWMMALASDTTPPTITSIAVTPSTLTPNNKMAPVTVSVTAVDDVDPQPVCSITSIDATEGDASDGVITGALTATVRATKDARGSARTYTLTVTCGDASQNTATAEVNVTVPSGKATGTLKHDHVTSAPWKGKKK
jgi:probable HAF family extracellular repeat protein